MSTLRIVITLLFLSLARACPSSDECTKDCSFGFAKDSSGCEVCQCQASVCKSVVCEAGTVCKSFLFPLTGHKAARCIDPTMPHQCHPPMDPGSCDGNVERYFYNRETSVCEQFVYGGCRGNKNNFEDEEKCQETCQTGLCEEISSCDLECERGRVIDDQGCELCECSVEPPTPLECSNEATEEDCDLTCNFGLEKDEQGCKVCKCFTPECPDRPCDISCVGGFMKNWNGCELCVCATDILDLVKKDEIPDDCPSFLCTQFCLHGYVVDDTGCPQCECEVYKCELLIDCQLMCEFGRVLDDTGCPTCECNPDPCLDGTVTCTEPLICQPVMGEDGSFNAECKDPDAVERERPWCTPKLMCKMYCEHGFVTDEYGCDICECRDKEREECEPNECVKSCEFGYAYNENGCLTCNCLVDPCEDKVCILNNVCEQKKYCANCPAIGYCLADKLVRRIKLMLTYIHPPIEHIDPEEFEDSVEKSISQLMAVDDEYIRGMSVRTAIDSATTVEMHVVSPYGNTDLVAAFEKLKDYIENHKEHASIIFHGLSFQPSSTSVEVDYSSDIDFVKLTDSAGESADEDDTTMTIIIVCVIIGGVVIIAAIVAVILVMRNKKKSAKKEINRHSRVSYHQTSTRDSVRVA